MFVQKKMIYKVGTQLNHMLVFINLTVIVMNIIIVKQIEILKRDTESTLPK